MRSLRGQRGLSTVGWIAILLLVGFASTAAIRIAPAYLDYYAVVSSAQAAQERGARDNLSAAGVREAVRRNMQVNDVDDLGYDIVKLKQTAGGIELLIDYEVRRPLVGNMDIVLKFNRRIGS